MTGQYEFPKGLFFGGKGPSRTHELLRRHMKSWIGNATIVAHLDFHTGLGAWGAYKLLIDHPLNPTQRQRLVRWFGEGSFEENDPEGVAYQPRGSFGQWCVAQSYAPHYVFAFAEFGTYGKLSVIAGLPAENQAHHWARSGDPRTVRAKQDLRELFCPSSDAWRTRALVSGLALAERAANGLAGDTVREGSPPTRLQPTALSPNAARR